MVDYPHETGAMHTWHRISLCSNAGQALKQLSVTFPCYLATNAEDSGRADIIKALSRVSISQYFKGIFCFRDIGFRKPSQEYFAYILKTLNCQPNEIVMVGDDVEKDYTWAHENGANAVLYDPRRIYKGEDVCSVNDLIELCSVQSPPEGDKKYGKSIKGVER